MVALASAKDNGRNDTVCKESRMPQANLGRMLGLLQTGRDAHLVLHRRLEILLSLRRYSAAIESLSSSSEDI
jgi:hypothetical protein